MKSSLVPGINQGVQVAKSRLAANVAYGLHRISGHRLIEWDEFSIRGKWQWADWSSVIFIDYGIGYLNFTVADIENSVMEIEDELGGQLTWAGSGVIEVCSLLCFFAVDMVLTGYFVGRYHAWCS